MLHVVAFLLFVGGPLERAQLPDANVSGGKAIA